MEWDGLHKKASGKVAKSPRLTKYRDVILADWPEGETHLRWVIAASVGSIEAWARQIQQDIDADSR